MKFRHRLGDNFIEIEECTQFEYKLLLGAYTKPTKAYKYSMAYRRGLWDGNFKYISGRYIPFGSWSYLNKVLKNAGIQSNLLDVVKPSIDMIEYDDFKKYVENLMKDSDFKPREYQIEAAYKAVKYKRCTTMLATSAGKTLIAFLIFSYLLDTGRAKKNLMVVPTTSLVTQAKKDFDSFIAGKFRFCGLYAGQEDISDHANVVVGTYQTMVTKDIQYYNKFDCVVIDECHKIICKSETKIVENCSCRYKIGMSGTIDLDFKYSPALHTACVLGPLVINIKAKDLQDSGYISDCMIYQRILDYKKRNDESLNDMKNIKKMLKGADEDYKRQVSTKLWSAEREYVLEDEKRLAHIIELVSECNGNVLILCQHIKYLEKMRDRMRDVFRKRNVFVISGETTVEKRDAIKKQVEQSKNSVIIATYGTCSTGISITNLNYLILTESYKSPTIILQSVGRLLRKGDDKDYAYIYDICDNLYSGCISYRHAAERKKLYDGQSFKNEKTIFNI